MHKVVCVSLGVRKELDSLCSRFFLLVVRAVLRASERTCRYTAVRARSVVPGKSVSKVDVHDGARLGPMSEGGHPQSSSHGVISSLSE